MPDETRERGASTARTTSREDPPPLTQSPLSKKFALKQDCRVAIINAPPEFPALLDPLPPGAEVVAAMEENLAVLILFVRSISDVERLGPDAVCAIAHDGLFWVAYPKRSSKLKSDISRDIGWDVFEKAGLDVVTQIAIDETWSASRFRPKSLIGKARRKL